MTNSVRTLSVTDLDLVSGGLRDKPDQDRLNKMIADGNRGPGTVGASIYNNQFYDPADQVPKICGNPL